MKKNRIIIGTLLFLLLVLLVYYLFVPIIKYTNQETVELQKGHADLSGFDFETTNAVLSEEYFTYYPNALYTPENLEQGHLPQWSPELEDERSPELREWENFGTYRMTLTLPAGKTYGISAYSAMYSQRLFVNSEELSVVGIPGTTKNTTIPGTTHYTVYFTPETDQTEILIQVANFHHSDGGGLLDLLLGTADNISARDTAVQTCVHMLEGIILSSFLLSMGIFFFFRRKAYLWFSLACFAVFVRIATMEENSIIDFLHLPWGIKLGMEYISLIMLIFCFVMYINSTSPGILNKHLLTVFEGGCAAYAIMVLLTPPLIYTRWLNPVVWAVQLFMIYVVCALFLHLIRRKKRSGNHLLLFGETLVFITFVLLDTYWHRRGGYHLTLGLTSLGMFLCIHLNVVVLLLNFTKTAIERDEAQRAEKEVRETNQLLERMNRVREEFLQNLSHELRTPLTVMSSYANLTSLEIRKNAVDDDTLENLDMIKRESIRLAALVEQLKKVSLENDRQLTLTDTDIPALLLRAAKFCAPICRNGNRITVEAGSEPIIMRINADTIFQVLVNLITNANRHTKQDTIILKVEWKPDNADSAGICISVIDHGEGISPDQLPNITKRYTSGGGGEGLGLAICKEIIEEHGGMMKIESKQGRGTTVCFTLPCEKGKHT